MEEGKERKEGKEREEGGATKDEWKDGTFSLKV